MADRLPDEYTLRGYHRGQLMALLDQPLTLAEERRVRLVLLDQSPVSHYQAGLYLDELAAEVARTRPRAPRPAAPDRPPRVPRAREPRPTPSSQPATPRPVRGHHHARQAELQRIITRTERRSPRTARLTRDQRIDRDLARSIKRLGIS